MRLPSRCLVVLVGPAGSGKSTWARQVAREEQILSSDHLRAVVGASERDQAASDDAFEVLHLLLDKRLRRGLFTIVDATSLEADRRATYLRMAADHHVPCIAVTFPTPAALCKQRNRGRPHPVPARVVDAQVRAFRACIDGLPDEGFDQVLVVEPDDEPAVVVPDAFVGADDRVDRQRVDPATLGFGLQVPRFDFGDPAAIGPRLREIAVVAEQVGFRHLWLMDHVVQIPSIGRHWEEMLEPWTTLAHVAAATDTLELGTLATGVTYRNVAMLGKTVATVDVLSGGRAWAGLGAAWYEREHVAYGLDFPPLKQRMDLLEDALELLPLMWGPGTPSFDGRVIQVPEAICYPRPLRQPRPPILVAGGGERRTLRLVAQHADACNLVGDLDTVRRKVDVVRRHCADLDRDPSEVAVTHLSTRVVGRDRDDVAARVERLRRASESPEAAAGRLHAGTVDDQVGDLRNLADAGVDVAIVSLADLTTTEPLERFAPVIEAFAG